MGKRPDLSTGQKKIVDRYYQNRDSISANKLGELVSELYLAIGDEKKSARLWKQAATALKNLGVTPEEIQRLTEGNDLNALARHAGATS
jgi:predicted transcriptional regulator